MNFIDFIECLSSQTRIESVGRAIRSKGPEFVVITLLAIALISLSACGQTGKSTGPSTEQSNQELSWNNAVSEENSIEQAMTGTRTENIGELEELMLFEKGFDRSTALHQLLARTSEERLPELLEQSEEISREMIREEAQSLIVQRMAGFDPLTALRQIDQLPVHSHFFLTELVFQEWSFRDLNDAVAHAKTLSTTQRMAAVQGILKSRDDLSSSLRDEIASQVGGEQFVLHMLAQSSKDEAIEFPEIAWDSLLGDAQNELSQIGLLIDVANAWVERDGIDALDRIYSSLTDWEVKIPVMSTVLHNLTLGDPHATIEYVVNLQGDYRKNALTQAVLQSFATSDPQGALDVINSTEEAVVPRMQMQHSVLQTWASKDPNDLLDNIQDVPKELQSAAQEYAIVVMARTDAKLAVTQLERSNLEDRIVHIASQIVDYWADQDAQNALDWVLSNPDLAEYKQELLVPVFNSLALEDPTRAMELALNQPNTQEERGMELIVIDYLARKDIQKALELLPLVRQGPTKFSAYSSVGRALIEKKRVNQLLSLARSLSNDEQESFWATTVDDWAFRKPRLLYKSLDELPYDAIKHKAASRLVELNSHRVKVFSTDEVDSLKELISKTIGPN